MRKVAAVALLVAILGLGACRQEARLDAVAAEKAKAVRRTDHFQSVAATAQRLVAVGAFGVVAVSADGGAGWTRTELAGAPGLIKAAACGDGSFALLDFAGAVWRAGPEARDWQAFPVPATDALLDLACTADGRLWVAGARGALFASADGGKTWADKSLPEDIQLLNIQFPTAAVGVVAGEFGRVLLTRDGGATWAEGGSLGPEFYPQGMDFKDEAHGVVVGLGGAVLETADGGRTWARGKAPTEAPLYGVRAGENGKDTVVVGAAGTGFRQQAGGTWRPIAGLPLTDLRGIAAGKDGGLVLAGTGALLGLPDQALSASAQ